MAEAILKFSCHYINLITISHNFQTGETLRLLNACRRLAAFKASSITQLHFLNTAEGGALFGSFVSHSPRLNCGRMRENFDAGGHRWLVLQQSSCIFSHSAN
jgi:hypothetical protein